MRYSKAEKKYNALMVTKWIVTIVFLFFLGKMTSVLTNNNDLLQKQQSNYNELRELYQVVKNKYHVDIENNNVLYKKEEKIDFENDYIKEKEIKGFVVDYYWFIFLAGGLIFLFLLSIIAKRMKRLENKLPD